MMWTTPSYDYRHLVTLEETNLVGNVYFANYLRWQGQCREHFLVDRAPGVLRALTEEDLALATVSCHCDYFSELYAADTVELRMTLESVNDTTISMNFDYYRLTASAELVARGAQTTTCMRRTEQGPRPVAVPEELLAALEPYGRSNR
ncbi:enediyne biosynthesis thioesterase [Saccharopolyspora lacisalsi]|uniref:Enediyne biosynthesis thioesterase n=1 Tax=Halosaccharopolyspora lacisalsi TaxID=1000566 RepID=A0A839DZS1_9PSEU|nr:thioesterase family protein [Halosaccharopolyspora lacisalsi]MBA8824987.1 enediyne biosynthesis thioesterase [Halosaccharopolyspora lacisalsi]